MNSWLTGGTGADGRTGSTWVIVERSGRRSHFLDSALDRVRRRRGRLHAQFVRVVVVGLGVGERFVHVSRAAVGRQRSRGGAGCGMVMIWQG